MPKLPEPQHTTVQAIFREYERRNDSRFSRRLGASIIGRECERELWYSFRWATVVSFEGRMLRLFHTGDLVEARFVEDLRAIGVELYDRDPQDPGEQITFTAIGGHFVCKVDGVGRGLVEAPEKWHVFEFKSANDKNWRKIAESSVEKGKPEHYAQTMVGMHLAGIDRGAYLCQNKDTDEIHFERIKHSAKAGDVLIKKAERIIASSRPLPKLSDDPAFWKCKFCDHRSICHGQAAPVPTCRTCCHATPELDGDGRWSCALHGRDLTADEQLAGCPSHAYIPDLLANWAEQTDVHGLNVEYRSKINGQAFLNGPGEIPGAAAYSSVELYQAEDLAIIGQPVVDELRREFGGRVCG